MTDTGNDIAGKMCEVDGIGLHYRTDGERSKPCLVLSNSLGTDLSMWDAQAAALAGDFLSCATTRAAMAGRPAAVRRSASSGWDWTWWHCSTSSILPVPPSAAFPWAA